MKTWEMGDEASEEDIARMSRSELVNYVENARGFECYDNEELLVLQMCAIMDLDENKYIYWTLLDVREAFWKAHPEFEEIPGQTQNDYKGEVRFAWCDFVDILDKDNQISSLLAQEVTL